MHIVQTGRSTLQAPQAHQSSLFLPQAALVVGSALQSTLTKADSWLEGRGVLGKVEQDTARASLTPKERKVLEKLQALRLDDRRVIAREHKREKEGRGVKAPWLIKGSYVFLCWVLDILYANRPIQVCVGDGGKEGIRGRVLRLGQGGAGGLGSRLA